jgi:hypothetical protein
MTKTKDIIRIDQIVKSNSGFPMFSVFKLTSKENVFTIPMPSSFLDIYQSKTENFEREQRLYAIKDIKCKLFSVQLEEGSQEFAFFPMSDVK